MNHDLAKRDNHNKNIDKAAYLEGSLRLMLLWPWCIKVFICHVMW